MRRPWTRSWAHWRLIEGQPSACAGSRRVVGGRASRDGRRVGEVPRTERFGCERSGCPPGGVFRRQESDLEDAGPGGSLVSRSLGNSDLFDRGGGRRFTLYLLLGS